MQFVKGLVGAILDMLGQIPATKELEIIEEDETTHPEIIILVLPLPNIPTIPPEYEPRLIKVQLEIEQSVIEHVAVVRRPKTPPIFDGPFIIQLETLEFRDVSEELSHTPTSPPFDRPDKIQFCTFEDSILRLVDIEQWPTRPPTLSVVAHTLVFKTLQLLISTFEL